MVRQKTLSFHKNTRIESHLTRVVRDCCPKMRQLCDYRDKVGSKLRATGIPVIAGTSMAEEERFQEHRLFHDVSEIKGVNGK